MPSSTACREATSLSRTNCDGRHKSEPAIQAGPVINGKQTAITLFSLPQLAQSKFVSSLKDVSNEAFRQEHVTDPVIPSSLDRVPGDKSVLDELGSAPDTFTYIIHNEDDEINVLATATIWRFTMKTPVAGSIDATPEQLERARVRGTFKRQQALPLGVEGWELTLMAVSPKAQKQGLATALIEMCEAEIRRRAVASGAVRFVLTCVKEINGDFYSKRGFTLDSQTRHPPGTFGSIPGFTVAHYSKSINRDTQ